MRQVRLGVVCTGARSAVVRVNYLVGSHPIRQGPRDWCVEVARTPAANLRPVAPIHPEIPLSILSDQIRRNPARVALSAGGVNSRRDPSLL